MISTHNVRWKASKEDWTPFKVQLHLFLTDAYSCHHFLPEISRLLEWFSSRGWRSSGILSFIFQPQIMLLFICVCIFVPQNKRWIVLPFWNASFLQVPQDPCWWHNMPFSMFSCIFKDLILFVLAGISISIFLILYVSFYLTIEKMVVGFLVLLWQCCIQLFLYYSVYRQ